MALPVRESPGRYRGTAYPFVDTVKGVGQVTVVQHCKIPTQSDTDGPLSRCLLRPKVLTCMLRSRAAESSSSLYCCKDLELTATFLLGTMVQVCFPDIGAPSVLHDLAECFKEQ